MFLLVALVYVRIIYHRHWHASEESRARTATSSERITCSMSPSGMFIYIYKVIMAFIQKVPPQNFARSIDRTLHTSALFSILLTLDILHRLFLFAATAIRGIDIVLLVRHVNEPKATCNNTNCFPR